LSRWPPEQIKAEYNGLIWYFQDSTCSSRSFVWFKKKDTQFIKVLQLTFLEKKICCQI